MSLRNKTIEVVQAAVTTTATVAVVGLYLASFPSRVIVVIGDELTDGLLSRARKVRDWGNV
jgi:hypothetical protein